MPKESKRRKISIIQESLVPGLEANMNEASLCSVNLPHFFAS